MHGRPGLSADISSGVHAARKGNAQGRWQSLWEGHQPLRSTSTEPNELSCVQGPNAAVPHACGLCSTSRARGRCVAPCVQPLHGTCMSSSPPGEGGEGGWQGVQELNHMSGFVGVSSAVRHGVMRG